MPRDRGGTRRAFYHIKNKSLQWQRPVTLRRPRGGGLAGEQRCRSSCPLLRGDILCRPLRDGLLSAPSTGLFSTYRFQACTGRRAPDVRRKTETLLPAMPGQRRSAGRPPAEGLCGARTRRHGARSRPAFRPGPADSGPLAAGSRQVGWPLPSSPACSLAPGVRGVVTAAPFVRHGRLFGDLDNACLLASCPVGGARAVRAGRAAGLVPRSLSR